MDEIMVWAYLSGFFVSLIFLIVLMGWVIANKKDLGGLDALFHILIGILGVSAFSWLFILLILSGSIFNYIKDRK